MFPSESRYADLAFAQQSAVEFCNRRVAAGTTAAMVFGSAFPHAQDGRGGDEWSIAVVLAEAFKVHISEPGAADVSMHPAEMLFIGTLCGARALDVEDRFGNFDVGKEADLVVIDQARTPALRAAVTNGVRSEDPVLARDQTVFALLMGIRDTSVAEIYVRGRRVAAAGEGL